MDIKDLKEYLEDNEYLNTALFENPNYETAIVGISEEGAIIYDYDKMVEYLVANYDMTEEEACDHLDYDTLNSNAPSDMIQPIVMFHIPC